MEGTSREQMDEGLLNAATGKLTHYLDKLLYTNDSLLEPAPMSKPQAQKTASPKTQTKKLLGTELI